MTQFNTTEDMNCEGHMKHVNPLNAELIPILHLLALVGATILFSLAG